MVDETVDKKDRVAVLQTICIVLLLIALAAAGFLTVQKYLSKDPAISPQEAQYKGLTEAVNRNPNDLDARQKLAYVYQMMQQYDLAKEQYMEILKLFPLDPASRYNLGIIAREEKNLPEAEQQLTKLINLQPDHLLGAIALGEIYLEQGKYEKVMSLTERALKKQKGTIDFHLLRGRALEKLGKLAEAKGEYNEVLKYVPNNKEATEGLARLK